MMDDSSVRSLTVRIVRIVPSETSMILQQKIVRQLIST